MISSRSAALKPLIRLATYPSRRRENICAPEDQGSRSSSPARTVSTREYLWLAAVGGMLIAAVLVVRVHSSSITAFIEENPVPGVCLFLALNILDAIVAPGATLPLIPVAAHAWGHVWAGVVTTAGWTLGSLIAFSIARRWGSPLVKNLTSLERLRQMKHYIPKDVFWSIVFLRLVMPMDVLSYLLGLFTHISWRKYAAATALGVTPPAFLLAYLGKLPHAYDIIAFGLGAVVVVAYITVVRRRTCRPEARAT
jgi:uncharacterized membrane protein YdjX (TVP38/TMEM64 family)